MIIKAQDQECSVATNFRSGQRQQLKERLKHRLKNALDERDQHKRIWSSRLQLDETKLQQFIISHSYLEIIIEYANHSVQRNLLFEILWEEKLLRDIKEDLKFADGRLTPEESDHLIPLTSIAAFKKYAQRAKKKGIVKTLTHGLTGQTSNHCKWTDISKDLVILYAIGKPTHASSREIYEDIRDLLDDYPELKDKGIRLVKPSTIRAFLKNEGGAYISYAKDNPTDFRRKILGSLRFSPPSATLIRVGVDAYVFQVVCADDDTQEPFQLLAEFIYEYKSKAILGLAFGHTESNITFRKAFRDYFITAGNRLFREVVMDRFSAHTCSKVKNFIKVLTEKGVKIIQSSNPNNNARLERFFGSFQDMCLGRFLASSYVGSGVKSRRSHAHPCRKVLIKMKKKDFLKTEAEMIHILTHFVKEEYNKEFKVSGGLSPMEIFLRQQSNSLCTLSDHEISFMTYDNHRGTIIGSGVFIKSGDYIYLYKKRSFEIVTQFVRRLVNSYIDPDNPKSPAYVFERGKKQFLFTMDNLAIVPCTLFDRTEEDISFVKSFNKETRDLTLAIKREISAKELRLETLMEGKDYRESMKAAKVKKSIDTNYANTDTGLSEKTLDPVFKYSNDPLKNERNRKKTYEQQLEEKWNL